MMTETSHSHDKLLQSKELFKIIKRKEQLYSVLHQTRQRIVTRMSQENLMTL